MTSTKQTWFRQTHHNKKGIMADKIKEDYVLEYSKSNRSKCKGCSQQIDKDVVRVGELAISDKFDGEYRMWFHTACFFKRKGQLPVSKLKGFDILRPVDVPKIKRFCTEEDPSKKRKADEDGNDDAKKPKTDGEAGDDEEKPGKDTYSEDEVKDLWLIKDVLNENYNVNELKEMMRENKKGDKGGKPDLINKIADAILRGRIPKCEECGHDRIEFHHGRYVCHGDASEWSKCMWKSDEPIKRTKWNKPEGWAALMKAAKKKQEQVSSLPDDSLFDECVFYVIGHLSMPKTKFNQLIESHGGTVLGLKDKVTSKISYVISSDEGVSEEPEKAKKARKSNIAVVNEHFVHDSINAKRIEDVGSYKVFVEGDDEAAKKKLEEKEANKMKELANADGKMKVIRKGRSVVDAYFKEAADYHVLEEKTTCYTVMLNLADVSSGIRGRNSFWTCQVLEHDKHPNTYRIFRRWGRVGETGNSTVKEFSSAASAKGFFIDQYVDKTGNDWDTRHNFEKVAGKFYPVDVDYGNDDDDKADTKMLDVHDSKGSKLPRRVQDVISLMFDIEMMKSTLAELEIDVKKMPLGKLTKEQISNGYKCLNEISKAIDRNDKREALSLTNKFYTLDFGTSKPPVIDNDKTLNTKIQLLDTLRDIEIAANLLKMDSGDSDANPMDLSYKKLNTDITPLDRDGELYKRLESYAVGSHDTNYFGYLKIQVMDIFEVDRQGEEERFKDWEEAKNRYLLWHGSRLTNWVGILSQGLRIAPPEAPKTGYRFGKGVYFADVISKSGSYCFTTPQNPVGFMILNEVALGDINKVLYDTYMEKAPGGTHSTQALGQIAPDAKGDFIMDNGTVIPLGSLVKTGHHSSCSHNEFIVYDTKQIRTRFLLKIKFY
ncbi:hypothetical protein PROFUN_04892 [Planoprotostelium fungivorum]|uniref:Poly [ADP-ribose] polymerase n=1 Tax=Planoprotostelium fungivorum TaxID=1890364 RepID=A0A2P6NF57_9EUKA|nr:hypothetical protein PROFUN_04892 [Planoprotostelium fungivorum]